MSNAMRRANGPALPEARFRVANLVRDPAVRKALRTVEDGLGAIPVLPQNKSGAAGSDNAMSIFHRAFLEAKLERARYEFVDMQYAIARSRNEKSSSLFAANRNARDRLRAELMRLAGLPAMCRTQLEWKKEAIGKVWLEEPVFRDAVARDEAYLSTKTRTRKEVA
jgi:hypothetical protein